MATTTTTIFCERLKEAFVESGRRASDVFREVGVKKATWYTWVGGRGSTPEPDTCLKLARALGVQPEWLITGKGPKRTVKPSFTQDQIDVAEAWPHLPPTLQEHIGALIRHAASDLAPALRGTLTPANRDLKERADRLIEKAQEAARKKTP